MSQYITKYTLLLIHILHLLVLIINNTQVNYINNTKYIILLYHFLLYMYRGADKSLDRHNSQCILFVGEDISFDASIVIYIYIYIYIYI